MRATGRLCALLCALLARVPRRRAIVRVTSRGGRERIRRVISSGGRETPAPAPPAAGLMPTPLGFAASDESPPLASSASPPWKISVLTLLAGAEAFLLVHLARSRRPARIGGI
jgi:hypothetical protein